MIARRPPTFMPGRPFTKPGKPPPTAVPICTGSAVPAALQFDEVVATEHDVVDDAGLAGLHLGALALTQIDDGGLGGALGCRHAGLGGGVGRVRRLDDGADFDEERQCLVLADDVATGLGAVREITRDVDADRGAGLGSDEPVVPALDDAALAEHDRERLEAVVAVVELDAVAAANADVVDDHGVAGLRLGAAALLDAP